MSNKIYTPSTPALIELWCSYSGAKSGLVVSCRYFSNTNQNDDTGYFTAEQYSPEEHTKVTEQEFINVIYNR